MIIDWIFTGIVLLALLGAILTGKGGELAAAVPKGAQAGVTLALSLAGSICLWTGVGKVMEKVGFTSFLSRLLRPFLRKIFPSTKSDPVLSGHLSANICANFLGLGNAATPMGILAAQRLAGRRKDGIASHELCRLVVLNTASIQLIPATVAAARVSLGCNTPFDILPAVWVTSLCSAGMGLTAAFLLGKVWKK
ncbi:MAG: spore maturation protein A [Oscillospiraceae bacterium]|nr:spore maturation protein A [Oscillospiraceae bacterium]